jgi:hypothetical protein
MLVSWAAASGRAYRQGRRRWGPGASILCKWLGSRVIVLRVAAEHEMNCTWSSLPIGGGAGFSFSFPSSTFLAPGAISGTPTGVDYSRASRMDVNRSPEINFTSPEINFLFLVWTGLMGVSAISVAVRLRFPDGCECHFCRREVAA